MRAAEQLDAVVVAKPLAERSTSVEAVPRKDEHWRSLLTFLTRIPPRRSASAATPARELHTAITSHGKSEKMLDFAMFSENCLLKYVGSQLR